MLPKTKIEDKMRGKRKFYVDNIQHDPNLEKTRDCPRCHYDERENSLNQKIESMTGTETISQQNPDGTTRTLAFSKLIVKRGKHDDCIGWDILWQ